MGLLILDRSADGSAFLSKTTTNMNVQPRNIRRNCACTASDSACSSFIRTITNAHLYVSFESNSLELPANGTYSLYVQFESNSLELPANGTYILCVPFESHQMEQFLGMAIKWDVHLYLAFESNSLELPANGTYILYAPFESRQMGRTCCTPHLRAIPWNCHQMGCTFVFPI